MGHGVRDAHAHLKPRLEARSTRRALEVRFAGRRFNADQDRKGTYTMKEFRMTGWVRVLDPDGVSRGNVKKVVITRDEWKRHAPGIRDTNAYGRRHGRLIYRAQAAINLIAGWVADERHESACDSAAARRHEAHFE
jgi:hypothetical protein